MVHDRIQQQAAGRGDRASILIGAAQRVPPNLPTYGEMAATYGGIARGAGPVLNSIKRGCDTAREPDLSALVVDLATGLPGMFRGQPVDAHEETDARWRDELQRIRNWDWAKC